MVEKRTSNDQDEPLAEDELKAVQRDRIKKDNHNMSKFIISTYNPFNYTFAHGLISYHLITWPLLSATLLEKALALRLDGELEINVHV